MQVYTYLAKVLHIFWHAVHARPNEHYAGYYIDVMCNVGLGTSLTRTLGNQSDSRYAMIQFDSFSLRDEELGR